MQASKVRTAAAAGPSMTNQTTGREASRITDQLNREAQKVQQEQQKNAQESTQLKVDIEVLTKQRADLLSAVTLSNQHRGVVSACTESLDGCIGASADIFAVLQSQMELSASNGEVDRCLFDGVRAMVENLSLVESQCLKGLPRLQAALAQLKVAEDKACADVSIANHARAAMQEQLCGLTAAEQDATAKLAKLEVALHTAASEARDMDVKLERLRLDEEAGKKSKSEAETRRANASVSLASVRASQHSFQAKDSQAQEEEAQALSEAEAQLATLLQQAQSYEAEATAATQAADLAGIDADIGREEAQQVQQGLEEAQAALQKAQEQMAEVQAMQDQAAALNHEAAAIESSVPALREQTAQVLQSANDAAVQTQQVLEEVAALRRKAHMEEQRALICNAIAEQYHTAAAMVCSTVAALPVEPVTQPADGVSVLAVSFTGATQACGMAGDVATQQVAKALGKLQTSTSAWAETAKSLREAGMQASSSSGPASVHGVKQVAAALAGAQAGTQLEVEGALSQGISSTVTELSTSLVPGAVSASALPDMLTLRDQARSAATGKAEQQRQLALAEAAAVRAEQEAEAARQARLGLAQKVDREVAILRAGAESRRKRIQAETEAMIQQTLSQAQGVKEEAARAIAQASDMQGKVEVMSAQLVIAASPAPAPAPASVPAPLPARSAGVKWPAEEEAHVPTGDSDSEGGGQEAQQEGDEEEEEEDDLDMMRPVGPASVGRPAPANRFNPAEQSMAPPPAPAPAQPARISTGKQTLAQQHMAKTVQAKAQASPDNWDAHSVTSDATSVFGGVSLEQAALPKAKRQSGLPVSAPAPVRPQGPMGSTAVPTPRRVSAGGRAPGDVEDEDEIDARLEAEARARAQRAAPVSNSTKRIAAQAKSAALAMELGQDREEDEDDDMGHSVSQASIAVQPIAAVTRTVPASATRTPTGMFGSRPSAAPTPSLFGSVLSLGMGAGAGKSGSKVPAAAGAGAGRTPHAVPVPRSMDMFEASSPVKPARSAQQPAAPASRVPVTTATTPAVARAGPAPHPLSAPPKLTTPQTFAAMGPPPASAKQPSAGAGVSSGAVMRAISPLAAYRGTPVAAVAPLPRPANGISAGLTRTSLGAGMKGLGSGQKKVDMFGDL